MKIKANIKGDSGLTDSQLMRSQKLFLKKNREAFDEMEKYGKLELERRRFQANAKSPKKTIWQKIVSLLGF